MMIEIRLIRLFSRRRVSRRDVYQYIIREIMLEPKWVPYRYRLLYYSFPEKIALFVRIYTCFSVYSVLVYMFKNTAVSI